jgi:3-oxoisoapionate decarboxylase
MRLGISSYTYVWAVGVEGFERPARPLTAFDLLAKAEELGVRVVQIADNLPLDRMPLAELDQLAAAAREKGVLLEVGTRGIRSDWLEAYLELAIRLRSPIVRVIIDGEASKPSVNDAVASIRRALPQFGRANVSLAIENHDRFPAARLLEIIERCESQHVGICLDTANSLGCGEDLNTVLAALGPHVINLHIKDFTARRLAHNKGFIIEGCPAGAGLVDIRALLRKLNDFGHRPNAILELWPSPEPTIAASVAKEEAWTRDSIRYLRQYIKD